jgi:tetratricopeptide (TPR) repeat protein
MYRGNFQKAVDFYNDSLRLGQDSVWLRKSLAKAHLSLGDTENAVRNWKKALQFNPFDQETKALVEKYSSQIQGPLGLYQGHKKHLYCPVHRFPAAHWCCGHHDRRLSHHAVYLYDFLNKNHLFLSKHYQYSVVSL